MRSLPGAPVNTLTWSSAPGLTYALSYSLDLITWNLVDGVISSGGNTTVYPHALLPESDHLVDEGTLFYRVELVE